MNASVTTCTIVSHAFFQSIKMIISIQKGSYPFFGCKIIFQTLSATLFVVNYLDCLSVICMYVFFIFFTMSKGGKKHQRLLSRGEQVNYKSMRVNWCSKIKESARKREQIYYRNREVSWCLFFEIIKKGDIFSPIF